MGTSEIPTKHSGNWRYALSYLSKTAIPCRPVANSKVYNSSSHRSNSYLIFQRMPSIWGWCWHTLSVDILTLYGNTVQILLRQSCGHKNNEIAKQTVKQPVHFNFPIIFITVFLKMFHIVTVEPSQKEHTLDIFWKWYDCIVSVLLCCFQMNMLSIPMWLKRVSSFKRKKKPFTNQPK